MKKKDGFKESEMQLQECTAVVVSMVKNTTGISLSHKKTQIFLRVAIEQFLFQPTWMGIEWSCRCINGMYWRFSFRKEGTSSRFYDVYYNFETGRMSISL